MGYSEILKFISLMSVERLKKRDLCFLSLSTDESSLVRWLRFKTIVFSKDLRIRRDRPELQDVEDNWTARSAQTDFHLGEMLGLIISSFSNA